MFTKDFAPQSPSDLLIENPAVATFFKRFVASDIKESVLLFGEPGAGKSAAANMALYHRIVQPMRVDFGDVKASSFVLHADQYRGIEQVESIVNWQNPSVDFALVQIDEVDELDSNQLLELRAFWDEHHDICGLLLTTNHVGKLSKAFRSRIRCLEFGFPSTQQLLPRVQGYLKSRGVDLKDAPVSSVIDASGRDFRKLNQALEDLIFKVGARSA